MMASQHTIVGKPSLVSETNLERTHCDNKNEYIRILFFLGGGSCVPSLLPAFVVVFVSHKKKYMNHFFLVRQGTRPEA